MGGRGCAGWSGVKGGKWDNCNSKINKIYLKYIYIYLIYKTQREKFQVDKQHEHEERKEIHENNNSLFGRNEIMSAFSYLNFPSILPVVLLFF